MDKLLSQVLDSHGGLDRWTDMQSVTTRVSFGGAFWALKAGPNSFVNETVELATKREHVVLKPFVKPDQNSELDVDADCIAIHGADGSIVERLDHPRASFAGLGLDTPWTALQASYFASYSVWNYLTAPFLFTYPGVEAHEIEPWQENGETWRRLAVTFPPSIATHSREQVFYYDADLMQRRMDYAPEVMGNFPVAQYTTDHKTFDGFVFPTQRRVYRRNPDGTADRSRTAISADFQHIAVR
jgi:hypothetical protein